MAPAQFAPPKALPSSAIRVIDNQDVASVTRTAPGRPHEHTGFLRHDYLHDGATGAVGGKSVRFHAGPPGRGSV